MPDSTSAGKILKPRTQRPPLDISQHQITAVDLPSYELDVEETVGGDEVCDADGEAAAEGVVVLGHHVGKLAVAAQKCDE